MERGGQGGRRRALARLLKGEGGVASQGRSSRLITFYLVTEPPDDMPDLECEEVRLKIFNLEKTLTQ
jgi:hypothetical protein